MNEQHMEELAVYIENLPDGAFDQDGRGGSKNSGCGCICHYAGILSGNIIYDEDGWAQNYIEASQDWMGITGEQWDGLYKVSKWPATQKLYPTKHDAAARIRHMIKTGE